MKGGRSCKGAAYLCYTGDVRVIGAWLSLVERTVRDREVGGSNPLAPTLHPAGLQGPAGLSFCRRLPGRHGAPTWWPGCGRLPNAMQRFLPRLILNVIALTIIAYIVPDISVRGVGVAILAALVLGLVNAVVRPILVLLTLPVTLDTLGLLLVAVKWDRLGWLGPSNPPLSDWWTMRSSRCSGRRPRGVVSGPGMPAAGYTPSAAREASSDCSDVTCAHAYRAPGGCRRSWPAPPRRRKRRSTLPEPENALAASRV